jgi:hypothetical protein
MMSKLMQWLRGGSDSSTTSAPAEPESAPEPPSMPDEPPADAAAEAPSEPAADEPS